MQAGGDAFEEGASPGTIGRPEKVGDEGLEEAGFGERLGDLVGVAGSAVYDDDFVRVARPCPGRHTGSWYRPEAHGRAIYR